jgi:phosphohistidine phosphatase
MKTLLVLRHGKSSWKYDDLSDHDRPLKKRGKVDAVKMGELIQKKDLLPDLILSSTAARANKTARIVANSCEYDTKILKLHSLYMASPFDILAIIGKVEDNVQNLLIIGHNPGLEDLVTELTETFHAMPTCALAHIELPINAWDDIEDASGDLRNLWIPKQL